jgi:hypothetical protein
MPRSPSRLSVQLDASSGGATTQSTPGTGAAPAPSQRRQRLGLLEWIWAVPHPGDGPGLSRPSAS